MTQHVTNEELNEVRSMFKSGQPVSLIGIGGIRGLTTEGKEYPVIDVDSDGELVIREDDGDRIYVSSHREAKKAFRVALTEEARRKAAAEKARLDALKARFGAMAHGELIELVKAHKEESAVAKEELRSRVGHLI